MSPERDFALDRARYWIKLYFSAMSPERDVALHFSAKPAKQFLIETVFHLYQLFYKLHIPKRLSKGSDEMVNKE